MNESALTITTPTATYPILVGSGLLKSLPEQLAPLGLRGALWLISDSEVYPRYGPAVESLLEELKGAGVPTLVLEKDDAKARRLFERGVRIIHRGLGEGALRAARLESARAIIANGSDDENAALSLSVRPSACLNASINVDA